MRGCLALIGRLFVLIVLGVGIYFLGRAAWTGVNQIRDQIQVRNNQVAAQATFPSVATRIALAATDRAAITATFTATHTGIPTDTATATLTPTETETPLPTNTATDTVQASPTTANSPTPLASPVIYMIVPAGTDDATATDEATNTATNITVPTSTDTDSPTARAMGTATLTATLVPSDTPLDTAVPATAVPTDTATNTVTNTAVNTVTDEPIVIMTVTPSRTAIRMPTRTPAPATVTAVNTATEVTSLTITTTPTRPRRQAPPTNTRAAAIPNTPELTSSPTSLPTDPSGDPIRPTLKFPPSPTPRPTRTPSITPTASYTFTAFEPTTRAELDNALVALQIEPTNPLPTVVGRSECTDKPQPVEVPLRAPRLKANGNDIMNVLLIGTDSDVDPSDPSFLTDTLMIVSINRTTNSVAMLSLPRDLYVCVPVMGMERINTAYQWGELVGWTPGGGFGLMQETILYNFGVPVHYYAMISITGFKTVIDTLGGIDIAVDCPIRDELRYMGDDSIGNPIYEPFTAEPGVYEMNGSFALWYVRSRKSSSDFDRNRRQQQMLRAIWRKARDSGLLQQTPNLWGQASQIIKTNLQLPDVLGLVPLAASLELDAIANYYMFKNVTTQHFRTPAGEDVQLPLRGAVLEMMLNFYTPPSQNRLGGETAKMEVQNATGKPGLDTVAVEALTLKGVEAAKIAESAPAEKTVVYDNTGGAYPATLKTILTALNLTADRVVVQADPNATADFKVVLGTDYNSCSAPGY